MNLGGAATPLSFLVCVRNDSWISDVDPISQRLYVMASSTFFGQSCAEVMTKHSLSSLLGALTKKISYDSIKRKEKQRILTFSTILEKLAQFF